MISISVCIRNCLCTTIVGALIAINCNPATSSTENQISSPVITQYGKTHELQEITPKNSQKEPVTEKISTSGNGWLYGGIGAAAVGVVVAVAGSNGSSEASSNDTTVAATATPTTETKKETNVEKKKESKPKITTPKDENPPDSQPVGPDIRGGDWSGYLYLVHGDKENVTASISQNGNHVIITTSSNQEYGRKFVGNINESGSIRVYDQRTGELWTTHEGPATKKRIDLYDYVDHYQALDRLYLER